MRKVTKSGAIVGVYAGSFDPLTVGHAWMIAEGAKLFPTFIVAIGRNPDKRYTFTDGERLAMLTEAAKAHRNVRVDSFENEYLIDYARSVGATHILRGIRSSADFEYERFMRNINGDFAPGLTTVFLLPPRELAEVSSSMVKGLIGPRGWEKIVRPYVPPPVYRKLLEQYHERRLAK
ncbi:MAG: pantetheine-phosphate adenylyltransferase [Chthoniobacter sp.]|nr:pantetheine-phosphate adenylyltransferase [Chthoniobacter sp.]